MRRFVQILKVLISVFFKARAQSVEHKAVIYRQAFEELGSVYLKLGQLLALRPDLLPPQYCREFYQLLDRVPPFEYAEVKEIIVAELGKQPTELFDEFNEKPLAAASFAQVHRSRIGDQLLAVKVLRPGIAGLVRQDLRILKLLTRLVDFFVRPATHPSSVVEELRQWTESELDLRNERTHIERFNVQADKINDEIRAPQVYPALSSEHVLTMELIEGRSLAQIILLLQSAEETTRAEIERSGFDRKVVMSKLIRHVLATSHIYGYFHADPHPANILFSAAGEIRLVDFGIVGYLNDKQRLLLTRYERAVFSGQIDAAFEALLNLCEVPAKLDRRKLEKEHREIMSRFKATFTDRNYLQQQIESAPMLKQTFAAFAKHRVKFPVDVLRYFKTFEAMEGLIFALYPEFSIDKMADEFKRMSILKLVTDALENGIDWQGQTETMAMKLLATLEDAILRGRTGT